MGDGGGCGDSRFCRKLVIWARQSWKALPPPEGRRGIEGEPRGS